MFLSFDHSEDGNAQICVGASWPNLNLAFLKNAQVCAIEIFFCIQHDWGYKMAISGIR